jgi:hypothetical protein
MISAATEAERLFLVLQRNDNSTVAEKRRRRSIIEQS